MFLKLLLCLCFFILVYTTSAQKYDIDNFSIPHGLPQSQVSSLAEDRLGYLWIGTSSSGVAKFDGKNFTRVTTKDGMLSNFVNDIKIDSFNNVWIVHPRGLSKFDGKSFKTFQVPDSITDFRRIISVWFEKDTTHIVSIPQMYGRVMHDSLHFWDRNVLPGKRIITILEDQRNGLYFFLNNKEVLMRKGRISKWTVLPLKEIIPKSFYRTTNSVIYNAGDEYAEVSRELGTAKLLTDPTLTRNILFYDTAKSESWYQSNDSLFAESSSGTVSTYIGSRVTRFFKDREKNIWVGTLNKGLFKLRQKLVTKIPETEGLRISSMVVVDDALWFGTYGDGLFKFEDGRIEPLFFDSRIVVRNTFNGLAISPSGEIWAATNAGVGVFNREGNVVRWLDKQNFPGNGFSTVAFDERGQAWMGSLFAGLHALDANTDEIIFASRRSPDYPRSIYTSRYLPHFKKVALGSESGYSFIDGQNVQAFALPSFKNSPVVSLASYQDSLVLLGSVGSGVVVHSPRSGEKININSTNGLDSDFVYFANADENNFIWIGTERGVTQIKLDEHYRIVHNRTYQTDETDQESFALYGGEIYFGTISGLYNYSDFTDREIERDAPLHFSSIKVRSEQNGPTVVDVNPKEKNRNFNSSDRSFAFTFRQIDKSDPATVRYSYRLENLDSRWSSPSGSNVAEYNGLPPGDYTFRVRVMDRAGNFGSKELAYSFSISPPFYATLFFKAILSVIALSFVAVIIYLRVRSKMNRVLILEKMRLEQQEILRKEMARDFHDEMGNQLARIINFTSQLQLPAAAPEYKAHILKRIEETAKSVYTGAKEFIWSLNPESEDIVQLCMHIREFGETLFAEKQIALLVDCIVDDSYKLPFGNAREISLIFKEAMTNTFKYSGATHVHLRLQRTSEGFEISVQDNGRGFDIDKVNKGNGFRNMMFRANRIKADLSTHSEPGKGTSISLQIKIKHTTYEFAKDTLQETGSNY
jgi:signal transduction histidine kinase/ligand-binding sensor domain-containing protein